MHVINGGPIIRYPANAVNVPFLGRYETRLKHEEESSRELKDQHTVLHREIVSLTKDWEQFKDEIRKLKDKEGRLLENMKSLEKDIQSHKKEIREREDTVTDKEKRIFDLKKKNQVSGCCRLLSRLTYAWNRSYDLSNTCTLFVFKSRVAD